MTNTKKQVGILVRLLKYEFAGFCKFWYNAKMLDQIKTIVFISALLGIVYGIFNIIVYRYYL